MRETLICQCPQCQQGADHPDKELHRQMNLLLSRLDEQQRRWYVALEANRLGAEGVRLVSQITGIDEKTIRRGQTEMDAEFVGRPVDGVRLPGAGRPPVEKKTRP